MGGEVGFVLGAPDAVGLFVGSLVVAGGGAPEDVGLPEIAGEFAAGGAVDVLLPALRVFDGVVEKAADDGGGYYAGDAFVEIGDIGVVVR